MGLRGTVKGANSSRNVMWSPVVRKAIYLPNGPSRAFDTPANTLPTRVSASGAPATRLSHGRPRTRDTHPKLSRPPPPSPPPRHRAHGRCECPVRGDFYASAVDTRPDKFSFVLCLIRIKTDTSRLNTLNIVSDFTRLDTFSIIIIF